MNYPDPTIPSIPSGFGPLSVPPSVKDPKSKSKTHSRSTLQRRHDQHETKAAISKQKACFSASVTIYCMETTATWRQFSQLPWILAVANATTEKDTAILRCGVVSSIEASQYPQPLFAISEQQRQS